MIPIEENQKTENMIQIEEDQKTQNMIQIEEEHKKRKHVPNSRTQNDPSM
jgi:hypothetical protein